MSNISKMSQKTNRSKGPKERLMRRILDLKSKFEKGQDYTTLYQYEFGPQEAETLNKIRMVWNLRETDETITKNLEKIAKKLESKKAA
jgi:hypothetical protein